jgi:hypothetical protein
MDPEPDVSPRYVNIPCPSGKHERSVVTYRDHRFAAMFCIPCEVEWQEPTSHPELRMGDSDDRDALRTAERRVRELTAQIELLRLELNRKIDEAADLMSRIRSAGGSSSNSRPRRAEKES